MAFEAAFFDLNEDLDDYFDETVDSQTIVDDTDKVIDEVFDELNDAIDLNEVPPLESLSNIDLNIPLDEEEEEVAAENVETNDTVVEPNVIQQTIELLNNDTGFNDAVNTPESGMIFPSGEEFAAFVYSYAYKSGFEIFVRSDELKKEFQGQGYSRKKSGEKEALFYMMKRIRMMCKKGGTDNGPESNVTGCMFAIDARVLKGESQMRITTCNLEHNHELVPEHRRFFVSFRNISSYFARRIKLNDDAGISVINSYNGFVLECGGHENVPFTCRDLRNAVNVKRRTGRLGGDAAALEDYFKKMNEINPDFYSSILRDDKGVLVNVFWADARCRGLFKAFPDAVTFDTTFMCNRNEMPFAPFIGVNHHGKSTLFAAALISHEDSDTFVWVFNQWLDCMGKAPSIIITDQCKAIGKAVRLVFGENFPHRLCIWHIMRNACKNLGGYENYRKIEHDLKIAVHDSLEVWEFEEKWRVMVDTYKLKENNWIIESYAIRSKWVPAFWKGTFCAGMSSTQRSEQQNRYFKMFVSIESGLRQFVSQFENALQTKVEEETYMNAMCFEKPPRSVFGSVVEAVFKDAYTNTIFKELLDELYGQVHTNVIRIETVGSVHRYEAVEIIVSPSFLKGRKVYEVVIDEAGPDFSCSCKLFEFKGLLCRHIIKGIDFQEIKKIPDKYILDRWRKNLVRGYEHIHVGYYDPAASARVKKAIDVTEKNDYIARLALYDDDAYEMYLSGIDALRKKLEDHVGIDVVESLGTGHDTTKVWGRRRLQKRSNNERHIVRNTPKAADDGLKDPPDKRGPGRARKIRQKSFKRKGEGTSQATPTRRPKVTVPSNDLRL